MAVNYLDIYNDGTKSLFIPTKKGIPDKLLVQSNKNNQIVDIQYSEFIKNPLDHIKNTYMQLNFDMTIATENKIQNYLIKDKQISKVKFSCSCWDQKRNEIIF